MAAFNQPNDTNAQTLAIDGQLLSVEQATITVNTLDDVTDGDITDGSVSLRDAIALASSGDTITFANGGTIALDAALGELNIAQSLTIDGDIDGDGEGDITIDGQGNSRVLHVNDGDDTTTVDVALSGLTITGGKTSEGAGIFNYESLAIADSTISGNSAEFSDGGGILNYSGTTSLTNSTVSGNSAYNNGGGISNRDGTTTLTNSTISGNSAGLSGGGIFNRDGTTDLSNSTVSGNSSRYGGGVFNSGGTTDLTNSTVSGNSSLVGGGMISSDGTTTLANSTISGNSATENGGGIINLNSTTILTSTIFAGNTASSGNEIFIISGTVSADANNLFGDSSQTNATAFSGFTPGSSDVVATSDGLGIALDAILDATGLQDNGGPTETIALAAGSPAINAGRNPDGLATDQRGEARVVDGQADIGAFEVQFTPPTSIVVTTLEDEDDGILNNDISLRDALGAIAPGGTITFASSLANGTISLDNGELVIDQSMTIDADNNSITIDGQGNSRVLNVNDGDDTTMVEVALSGLTITGGSASEDGGGISNRESLAIADSTISGNSAGFRGGGGIFNSGGTTSLTNSTVSGNSTPEYGGGIYNGDGTIDLINSTVSGNSAFVGSGVYNRGGTTNFSNSTVSGNSSTFGGGISNSFGTATLTNSTVSGNSATDNGGGIINLNSTTILTNTIIAGNIAADGNEIFVFSGTVNANANNLFGDSSQTNATAFSGFTPGSSDVVATSDGLGIALDAILDTAGLQDNGGPTETIALVDGSPAIDAGDSANIPADLADQDGDGDTSEDSPFDQRGTGFIRVIGTSVDIGAFEYQSVANTAPTITSAATADADENQPFAIDVEATDDTDAETSGLIYSITDGADAQLFSIDADTGEVTFDATPDFEMPGDDGADNVYNIQVTVADSGGLTNVQDIAITVTDVAEGGGTFNGTNIPNLIVGTNGPDTINGRNGNDTIYGYQGDGISGVDGSATPPTIDISPVTDNDTINTGNGNDLVFAGNGDDSLDGGNGRDTLNGGAGSDILDGGDRPDILDGGEDGDIYFWDRGDDRDIYTDSGTTGIDQIVINNRRNFNGLTATFNSTSGIEQIRRDDLGAFNIRGGNSAETWDFTGMTLDNATIKGRGGHDVITGTASTDTIAGGNGRDTLNGGVGNDILSGNSGNDTFAFGQGFGNDVITDFGRGNNRIGLIAFSLTGIGDLTINTVAGDTLITSAATDFGQITLSGFTKTLDAGDFLLN